MPAPTPPNLASAEASLRRELGARMPRGELVTEGPRLGAATRDEAAGNRGIRGSALALALPADAEEVAAVVGWCYRHEVPIVPRGGGTGFAGGAIPDGGLVLSLERMARVRSIDPGLWRMEAESGVTTATVHRLARENGLVFPPDPGAAEQSTLGGNIATNAGGPHAFKYGVTGAWVTGLEAVMAPGETVRLGGPFRKDVSTYDLVSLLVGSEGTLGVITAAWLRLVPAPEARAVVVAFYPSAAAGCRAISGALASGIQATALEFLDRGALEASLGSFPFDAPGSPEFALLAEVDGHPVEVERLRGELAEALSEQAAGPVLELGDPGRISSLWAWRDGVSIAVGAQRGGKVSEDIVVPLEKLEEAVEGTLEIGARHELAACSWGHAGDGNLHSTFLVDLEREDDLARAERAAGDLFRLAAELGGSISGEHGIGSLKIPFVEQAVPAAAVRAQAEIKRALDPKLLLNPGKKVPS